MWTKIWILFITVFHLQILEPTLCLSPLWDEVKTNVFQEYDVKEGNQVWVVRMDMGQYKSTDLVVGDGEDVRPDSRLILKCLAHHGPAEWVYSGDGEPEFTTNSTIENIGSDGKVLPMNDMNGAKRYVATLTLGKKRMTVLDTGRYNCMTASPETGMKYKTLSAFYHLYVPLGNKLFIRQTGGTVEYDLTKSAARIPCGVTNPKTVVSLQKLNKGKLEFVETESMLYHPISGFYPKNDISGTYICTAVFNDTYELIHFTLTPSSGDPYHQNVSPNRRKTSKKPLSRPEVNQEWLTNYGQIQYQRSTTKRPTITTPKPKKPIKQNAYIPFHIRYSTTTYGPFQTFYDIKSATTIPPYHHKLKTSTKKYKPFNPFEYPSDIMTEKITRRPSYASKPPSTNEYEHHDNVELIPMDLISYRPIFNYFKDTSRPTSTFHSQRPTAPISAYENTSRSPTRTTPRRYRPTTTTESSVTVPDTVICSQAVCGANSVCFVHNVYYELLNESKREAACKCIDNYIGNPYLECYPQTIPMDEDTLYFNSSFRSPLLPETLHSKPDGESSSAENSSATRMPVDIIDM